MAAKKKVAVEEAAKADDANMDVALVHSPTSDGEGLRIIRKRGDELSVGEVRPLEEGKPIQGDVVELSRRPEHPALFDVKTVLRTPGGESARSRAATNDYRDGWDALWGKKKKRDKSQLN